MTQHLQNRSQRLALAKKIKKEFWDFVHTSINAIREARTCVVADAIVQEFVCMIRHGAIPNIAISLPRVADRLGNSFMRITESGSWGLWRFSDVFDSSKKNLGGFDEGIEGLNWYVFSETSAVMNIPLSQSSIEAWNGNIKIHGDRLKQKIVSLIDSINNFLMKNTREEYDRYGFSYAALPYGGGSANKRSRSFLFSEALRDGMDFCGQLDTIILGDHRGFALTQENKTYMFRNP